ncbi:alpha/beta hydrolase [Aurantimonas sp. Leaf443]|uniref:RBBP9/YdeN family alpha/beta hydrolase n=1 Tax=Aurantimonas sp. Leaf443 TaxID=1736378 RepID=UPI0006F3E3FD|nr:alpha/beta hydrolase [Aurantimonas sp. Leaf443]KQT86263.1 alpha/beta hydrolase [Aurantimonas sp. Leaf443]
MRVSEADILILPGYKGSCDNHWQTRWERKLTTARRVEQAEWSKPVCEDWARAIADAVNEGTKPTVLVGHSLGVAAAVKALPLFTRPVAGAFFVSPPDVDDETIRPKHLRTFGPYPRDPLPFPSVVVASRNDGFSSFAAAEDIAGAWGSLFVDAGESGHINAESGHGPWPEGLLTFGKFIARLSPPA